MSCPAKDGRYVTGALRVRHPAMMVMMVTHMMTRGILGAGGYRLTIAVLLVHYRVTAIVIVIVVIIVVAAAVIVDATATAAANVGAAAAIVVGRIQRRLSGVVQSMQRVLLLCCFQICC